MECLKKDYVSQAHEAYALSAHAAQKVRRRHHRVSRLRRAGTRSPTMVRLARLHAAGKRDEPSTILDKVMAGADVHPQIKQFAQPAGVGQAKGSQTAAAARPRGYKEVNQRT